MKCVSIDMALANMGLAAATITLDGKIHIDDLKLVSTDQGPDKKQVRKSSIDLRRAIELRTGLQAWCALHEPAFAFVEVPSGSQSATAARALGIAVGVLASCPVLIIEVSPLEVKLASVGKKTASKQEMINWAVDRWPSAPWLFHGKGANRRLTQANEHLADACAAIAAGIKTTQFQLLNKAAHLYKELDHETTGTDHQRPALYGKPQGCVPVGPVPVARRPITPRGR